MSYANPDRRFYFFAAVDYGAGDSAQSIQGPKGKAGKLVDIHLAATETFNSVTTDGYTDIGTAADPNAYAHFVQGDLADTDSVSGEDGVTDTDWLIAADIPADTQVEVTFVAPTGGTPTGIANVVIVIDWAR